MNQTNNKGAITNSNLRMAVGILGISLPFIKTALFLITSVSPPTATILFI